MYFNHSYKDFQTFVVSTQGTVFRVWFLDELKETEDLECRYYYFRTVIPLNDNDYLIGMESAESSSDNSLCYIHFDRLSNMHFDYVNHDQEGWENGRD